MQSAPFRFRAMLIGVGLISATLALPMAAMAQSSGRQNTKIGLLNCNVAPGVGFIIGSSKSVTCRFTPNRGRSENYAGTIKRFGLDIGATNRGKIVWAVFAPTRPGAGTLAGDYVGASAEATVGAGVGANVLVGGFGRSISLQPLSVQRQRGLDVALGVADLTLTSRRR